MKAVALDGPAGAGKSTIARAIADELGYTYVDTGAMYRAVAFRAMSQGVDLEDEAALKGIAEACRFQFVEHGTRLLVDDVDVSEAIRTPEVTANVRYAARAAGVRTVLLARQQAMAAEHPVVMEGRDICTVVLPEADWKFYLYASAEVRARRRQHDFLASGHTVDLADLVRQIEERDASDMQVGPLKDAYERSQRAGGGIRYVDTSAMSEQEVVDALLTVVRTEERT